MATDSYNAELTLGPALLGTTLAAFLFGCSVLQTYRYYRQFPEDKMVLKIWVAAVMLLTLAHMVCLIYWTWTINVSFFDQPDRITIFSPSRDVNLIISPFICYLVQIYFAVRLFRFSKSWLLAIICCVLGGISLVGTIVNASHALNTQGMTGDMNAHYWLTILSLVSGAVCDLIITGGLVFYLRKKRATVNISRTIDMLDKLTLWSIETGLITSINAILVIIFFSVKRTTFIWAALYNVLADVYTNTLLAALNSRTPLTDPHVDGGRIVLASVLRNGPTNECNVSQSQLHTNIPSISSFEKGRANNRSMA